MHATGVIALVKVLHVLLAASWVGAAIYSLSTLKPVMMALAPSARGELMGRMMPASIRYYNIVGGLTILSGLALVYVMRDGFSGLDDSWGRMVMAGLLISVAVLAISGLAIKRSFRRLGEAMKDARPGEPPSMMAQILQKRIAIAQMGNTLLLVLAMVFMVAANVGLQL